MTAFTISSNIHCSGGSGAPDISRAALDRPSDFANATIEFLHDPPNPLRAHWFFLVAPLVIAADLFVALDPRGGIDRLVEAGLLFDLAVVLPCLYWLCYRGRGRKAVIRAAALSCLGIWAALKLVPNRSRNCSYTWLHCAMQASPPWCGWRWRCSWPSTAPHSRGVGAGSCRSGAGHRGPSPWVARIVALEATFWRGAWRALKRFFGGNT